MFHSMTRLSNDAVVIIGGRSSPKEIFGDILVLKCHNFKDLTKNDNFADYHNFSSSDVNKLSMPVPTWRHSASLINVEGIYFLQKAFLSFFISFLCILKRERDWKLVVPGLNF